MRNKLITGAFLVGAWFTAPLAIAEQAQNVLLEGRIFSTSATIAEMSTSADIFEVPGGKFLIVTQFCRSFSMGPELVGSKLGRVPVENTTNCTTYVPGVVFRGRQTVSCVTAFNQPASVDVSCLINGVIQ